MPKDSILNAWNVDAATANPVATSVTPIITRLTELKETKHNVVYNVTDKPCILIKHCHSEVFFKAGPLTLVRWL